MAANWLQNILTIQKTDTYQARPFNAMTIKGGNKTGKKYERNIKPTTEVIKIYNNTALNPVGKCKIQLQDPETKQKLKVPFTIVDDEQAKSKLLGCRTAQQMKIELK